MSERKTVTISDDICGRYDTYSLRDMIDLLTRSAETVPIEQRDTVRFEIDMKTYEYDTDEYPKLFMKYERPETDVEYARRQWEEAYYMEQVKKNDLATYERLRKQFEGK